MDREEIVQKFENLNVWQKGGKKAPHKPLLVLYAIGALLKGRPRLLPYKVIDEHLGYLLGEFNSTRSVEKAYVPFWRLQSDGVWEVTDADKIGLTSSNDPYKGDLVSLNVSGGFTVEVFSQFRTDTSFAIEIALRVLNDHFSARLHSKVLYWTWVDCKGPRAK